MKIRHRFAVFGAAITLVASTAVILVPTAAAAHGVAQFPGARTYLCYLDAVRQSGELNAYNPACKAAIAESGTTPLYNWFAVLRSDAAGKTTNYIPDNQLCSGGTGGPYDFRSYNANRSDWPVTHLTSGSTIQFNYSNWAKHPGTFFLSITRQGWTPSMALNWSDLSEFASVTNPPDNGNAGDVNHWYYWNQTLPSGRSGPAIIYIRWVRSDSSENFFSCSDVTFDGGTGQVTGVGPNQTLPPPTSAAPTTRPPTSAPPTSRPPTSAPPTSRPPTSAPPTSRPPTSPPPVTGGTGACTATYATIGTWSGGFQGEVTVRAGTTAISSWTTNFTVPSGTSITQVWSASGTTPAGPNVSFKNVSYNGTVAANGTTTYGFLGSGPAPSPSVSCTSS